MIQHVAGYLKEDAVKRRAGSMCAETLADGFFAKVAVLMEGSTEVAVVSGCAQRRGEGLGAEGINLIDAGGKDNLILCHAILNALEVPCYVVFDGDGGQRERKMAGVQNLEGDERRKAEEKIERAVQETGDRNVNLLGYLGADLDPAPSTSAEATHTVFSDDLEIFLRSEWPAWEERRRELVRSGDGHDAKHAATYREAARTAATDPPFLLVSLLEHVRTLARG